MKALNLTENHNFHWTYEGSQFDGNCSVHRIHEGSQFDGIYIYISFIEFMKASNLTVWRLTQYGFFKIMKVLTMGRFESSKWSSDPLSKFDFIFTPSRKSTSPSCGSATRLTALWEAAASTQEECGSALTRGNKLTHPSSHCIHQTGCHSPARWTAWSKSCWRTP